MFSVLAHPFRIALALFSAFAVSYFMVPSVKRFAESVGAIDMPNARRINKVPVPRMGGIAIFYGFIFSAILFVDLTDQVKGILIGSGIIAIMGGFDDVYNLSPMIKLAVQIAAAVVCVACGVMVDGITNFMAEGDMFFFSQPVSAIVTVLWIVGCTNAINLIDGLDGLAVGMSCISATTLFIISVIVEDININVSVILVCVIGACTGFWPYNRNPARIFMGDVGSQMLGFLLSTISVMGLFKMHALVTMLIPFLAMAVPLADTAFAFIRRILKGQSPFHADKGHFHHRLLAMGLTQKQAVTVMYAISIMLGVFAYLMIGKTRNVKIVCLVVAFVLVLFIVVFVLKIYPRTHPKHPANDEQMEEDIKIYHEKGRSKNE
ncbi:MAG: undecaprenyl/decaprenyl-phosphate alpha-N-acetylglucosaminyl 1-phosphate transferase [Oscillospiraceae bacterium]|nr:undecaprenyl/decaprenyl-phosphate alpha-N-acetylglucosaminyl 1-phosphate transferase [Oscillospiraceae bacterium]